MIVNIKIDGFIPEKKINEGTSFQFYSRCWERKMGAVYFRSKCFIHK
jgi:hypothetical protein